MRPLAPKGGAQKDMTCMLGPADHVHKAQYPSFLNVFPKCHFSQKLLTKIAPFHQKYALNVSLQTLTWSSLKYYLILISWKKSEKN